VKLPSEDQRREAIDNERELRMHGRLRDLAWVVILAPIVTAAAAGVVWYAAFRLLLP
jgi:hypothetical protein